MSGVVLLDGVTTAGEETSTIREVYCSNNDLLFVVYGEGNDFSATVYLYPVFNNTKTFESDKITINISNTEPNNNTLIVTPHRKFKTILSGLVGSASITAIMEG
jgi:hypothetical protein